jgi:hypothetical protein
MVPDSETAHLDGFFLIVNIHCPSGRQFVHPGTSWRCAPAMGHPRVKLGNEKAVVVDALAERLDSRLREWKPETAAAARERIVEIIALADHDVLDLARSLAAEEEVLDLLDEPTTR